MRTVIRTTNNVDRENRMRAQTYLHLSAATEADPRSNERADGDAVERTRRVDCEKVAEPDKWFAEPGADRTKYETAAENAMQGVLAAAAMTIVAVLGEAQADGPFNVLEWRDGVTTSRNGYAVWVGVASIEHEARLPGHESEVSSTNNPSHRAALGLRCRAAGGPMPNGFPPSPASGGVTLDDHPDQPGAYTVLHPMHWILELAGRHREHWPLQVRVGDGEAVESTLVRRLTDYSAPYPGLDIAIPGHMLVEAVIGRETIEIEATGRDVRFKGRFEVTDNARRAAALMRDACATP